MTGNLHDLPEGYSHVMLEGEYLDAANELRAIQQEKKDLATREAECKRIIEKHLAVGERGITPDGEEVVAVRAGAARFSADLAAANLPKELLAQISTVQADGETDSPGGSTNSAERLQTMKDFLGQ